MLRPQKKFQYPLTWTDKTFADRGNDVRRLLAAVSSQAFPHVDRSRVALVGHSLGGYTVLCVGGARKSWALPGHSLKAIVALSPYCAPLVMRKQMGHLNAPVMFQGGTIDYGITPAVRRPGGAYDQASPPKVYVELAGAGHLSWTDLRSDQHELIDRYVVAFLDHYVKGRPANPILTNKLPGVSDLRSATSKR